MRIREALTDNACSVAATGTLSATDNPVALASGLAIFSGVSYARADDHLEGDIYLGATASTLNANACSQYPVWIKRKFNSGLGYAVFNNNATGLSGASAASKQESVGYQGMAVDSLGRIVLAGYSYILLPRSEAVLWRYFPDGTLDTSFNSQGYLVYQQGDIGTAGAPAVSKSDYFSALQIDSQGRYVISGRSKNSAGGTEMVVWRFLATGAIDTSFNSTGFVIFQPGGLGAAGHANDSNKYDSGTYLKIDSQGRYVIAGSSKNAAGGTELTIWRYTSDGAIDTSFNNTGYTLFQPGGTGAAGQSNASKSDAPSSFEIDSQGRYVIGGSSKNSVGGREFVIWRYLSTGALDTSFNSQGYVIFQPGGLGAAGAANDVQKAEYPYGMLIDSQSRIVIGGYSSTALHRLEAVIWRYLSDGTLDSSFGTGGVALFQHGGNGVAGKPDAGKWDQFFSIRLDSQGRYVLAGRSMNASGASCAYELAILRYLEDGSLDTTFNGSGYYLHDHGGTTSTAGGPSKCDTGNGLLIDSQGRYLIAGYSTNASGGLDFTMWRVLPEGSADK